MKLAITIPLLLHILANAGACSKSKGNLTSHTGGTSIIGFSDPGLNVPQPVVGGPWLPKEPSKGRNTSEDRSHARSPIYPSCPPTQDKKCFPLAMDLVQDLPVKGDLFCLNDTHHSIAGTVHNITFKQNDSCDVSNIDEIGQVQYLLQLQTLHIRLYRWDPSKDCEESLHPIGVSSLSGVRLFFSVLRRTEPGREILTLNALDDVLVAWPYCPAECQPSLDMQLDDMDVVQYGVNLILEAIKKRLPLICQMNTK